MSKPVIPEALMTKPLQTVSTMRIETSVLEPLVISQTFCRFVLDKKGILDMGSAITVSVHPTDAVGNNKSFLPIRAGAHCVVKRAVLRIADKVVATTDDYAHYMAIKRQARSVEEKSMKDMVKVGTLDAVCPDTQEAGKIQLRDLALDGDEKTGHPIAPILLTTSLTECPIFSIKLSELFPMMVGVQLPLFVINDSAVIELYFNTQATGAAQLGNLCNFELGEGGDTSAIIGLTNVKLLADYLFYEDGRMGAIADAVMSKDGLVIPYDDLVLTTTTFPSLAGAGEQKLTRDIGVSGMLVKNILVSEGFVTDDRLGMFGPYGSKAFYRPDAYNVRVNDVQKYPRDIVSESRKYVELSLALGAELTVSGAEYSLDRATEKVTPYNITNEVCADDITCQLHPMTQLTGAQHYIGIDMRSNPYAPVGNGTRVGIKPIQMLHTLLRTAQDLEARTVRYFTTVERVLQLRGGSVVVSA